MRTPIHGKLLVITGIVHTAVTFMPKLFAAEWGRILSSGIVNTLPHDLSRESAFLRPDLELAFWFMIAGPALCLAGLALHRLERLESEPPLGFALLLTAIAVLGTAMMPISGFTVLLLPQAAFMLVRAIQARRRRESPPVLA